MRYVSVMNLRGGMELAKPIYSENFNMLLAEGSAISPSAVRRINELGYPGVYINDVLSAGITVPQVISPALRLSTVKSAKEILVQASGGAAGEAGKIAREHQKKVIMPVIEAIISSRTRLIDAIDLKPYSDYEYYHASNVTIISLLLGVAMGISGTQLYELGLSALLHDVGNIFIPDNVIGKPGKLTPEEYEIIKKHSQMGFDYLKERFDISIEACMGALQHHEHYDGSGYPNGLGKDRISIYGRIVAVAEVYDSLTSRRPFRPPMFPSTAIEFLQMNTGTKFDPGVIEAFKNVIAPYPVGTCVELTTGEKCIVEENYPGFCARPRLRALEEGAGVIDLKNDPSCRDTSVSHVIEI